MRSILTDLRRHALDEADAREHIAFDSAGDSQRPRERVLLVAIIIALGSGAWIARDIAGTTAQLEEAPSDDRTAQPAAVDARATRRARLGGPQPRKMNALLLDKDAGLRATLAERERAVADLTRANDDLALRDARRAGLRRVRSRTDALDVHRARHGRTKDPRPVCRRTGGRHLPARRRRPAASPSEAMASDGRAFDHAPFGAGGLPRNVMSQRAARPLRQP